MLSKRCPQIRNGSFINKKVLFGCTTNRTHIIIREFTERGSRFNAFQRLAHFRIVDIGALTAFIFFHGINIL